MKEGDKIVVYYDDGGTENNVKRKEGKFVYIDEDFLVFDEEDKKGIRVMIPHFRIIKLETTIR